MDKIENKNELNKISSLINHGADIDAKNEYGNTPLHEAVYDYNTEIVKLLLDHGADVNAEDNNGNTPSDLAYGDNTEIFKLLLEYSANPNKGM